MKTDQSQSMHSLVMATTIAYFNSKKRQKMINLKQTELAESRSQLWKATTKLTKDLNLCFQSNKISARKSSLSGNRTMSNLLTLTWLMPTVMTSWNVTCSVLAMLHSLHRSCPLIPRYPSVTISKARHSQYGMIDRKVDLFTATDLF